MDARTIRPVPNSLQMVIRPHSRKVAPYITVRLEPDARISEAEGVFEVLDVAAADNDREPQYERACGDDLRGERGVFAWGQPFNPVEDAAQIEDRDVEPQQHQRRYLEPEGDIGGGVSPHCDESGQAGHPGDSGARPVERQQAK